MSDSSPFKQPLGLFLQGGGALGAWQAGALEALAAAGVRFDAVMGFSIGALNGYAVAYDKLADGLKRWRRLDGWALRPSLRLYPFSLCSTEPLQAFLGDAREEAAAKSGLRRDFTIVSACLADGVPINARFTPGGNNGWDGPLTEHAAASCAIPLIFPPVDLNFRGRAVRLVDGGVPVAAPLDFSPLAASPAVLVLEMVRADEVGRFHWTPWRAVEQGFRDAGRKIVDDALLPLLSAGRPLYRLAPSRRLDPLMLDFRSAGLARMLAQGAEDAKAFLAAPETGRAR
ncbi:MAG: patatin-like phospholipase family protein [Elusimicrobia bacterium]|nr:patatin-like phospholipase family protein [Elusimicrobiota bacterium]